MPSNVLRIPDADTTIRSEIPIKACTGRSSSLQGGQIDADLEAFPASGEMGGLTICVAMGLIIGLNFPYDVDSPLSRQEISKNIDYYNIAYQTTAAEQDSAEDPRYLEIAREAAQEMQIEGRVRNFVKTYGLAEKKVLEIGSGRGYLQDIVNDYTGLDISPSVRRFYHQNFVLGSASSMPSEDSTFDGGWSIWVLEHVPNPEAALAEIRRV